MPMFTNLDAFRHEVRYAALCSGMSMKKLAETAQVSEASVHGLVQSKRTRWFVLMRVARALGREAREIRNGEWTLQPSSSETGLT